MPLTNYVKGNLVTCSPAQTVMDAAELMKKYEVGAILVVNPDRTPAGIITDRDIVLRCVGEGIDPNIAVKEIMTSAVKSVNVSDGLMDILRCMKEEQVRRVPLVDDQGKAVALLSFGDVLELLVTELSLLAVPATPDEKKIEKESA